ncbi:MAG: DUF2934 domain-containing protein [Roseiarcus sp.]|uniref:DUF2934 domain-containing protein n=1 Tax=Roseiarcus sp. TaxID=1969460 RepID=UPI003C65A3AE
MSDRNDRIREVAYFLWLEDACPEGQAERHWSIAEALLASDEFERKQIEGEPPGDPAGDSQTASGLPGLGATSRPFGGAARLSRSSGRDTVDNAAAKGVTRKATAGAVKPESGFDAADGPGASGPAS